VVYFLDVPVFNVLPKVYLGQIVFKLGDNFRNSVRSALQRRDRVTGGYRQTHLTDQIPSSLSYNVLLVLSGLSL